MIKDAKTVVDFLVREIKANMDVAVVGLSGGVDSTVVASLCKLALGKEKVYGLSMPYGKQDERTFNLRSTQIAEKLEINHKLVSIKSIADAITNTAFQAASYFNRDVYVRLNQVNQGNARSRARMTVLYAVAHELGAKLKESVRVVGTDNLSEAMLGYFTKFGDGGVDINPIGQLYKSEVYQLADYFIDQKILDNEMVDRIPSAGLWEGQDDESELGFSYDYAEEHIRRYLTNGEPAEDVKHRIESTKHKRSLPDSFNVREFCD